MQLGQYANFSASISCLAYAEGWRFSTTYGLSQISTRDGEQWQSEHRESGADGNDGETGSFLGNSSTETVSSDSVTDSLITATYHSGETYHVSETSTGTYQQLAYGNFSNGSMSLNCYTIDLSARQTSTFSDLAETSTEGTGRRTKEVREKTSNLAAESGSGAISASTSESAHATVASDALYHSTETWDFTSTDSYSLNRGSTHSFTDHREGAFANWSFSFGCLAYDQADTSSFSYHSGHTETISDGVATFTIAGTTLYGEDVKPWFGTTSRSSYETVALSGEAEFTAGSAESTTQTSQSTYTLHATGTFANGYMSLNCWVHDATSINTLTHEKSQESTHSATASGSFRESEASVEHVPGGDTSVSYRVESSVAVGTQQVSVNSTETYSATDETLGNYHIYRKGTFANGTFNLSSVVYQAGNTMTLSEDKEAVANRTFSRISSSNVYLEGDGGDASGYANLYNGALFDNSSYSGSETITHESSTTSTFLNGSEGERVEVSSAYEAGTLAGGILSLSSVLYLRTMSSAETTTFESRETLSVEALVSDWSGDGYVRSIYFGEGTHTYSGDSSFGDERSSHLSSTSEETRSSSSRHAGTYNGSRFSFSCYVFDESTSTHKERESALYAHASAEGDYAAATDGSFSIGGLFTSIGPVSASDSGTFTFDSRSTTTSESESRSTYTQHQEGTGANGRYSINTVVIDRTNYGASEGETSSSSLLTMLDGGINITGSASNNRTDESSALNTFHQFGSWANGSYSLSSVLYDSSASEEAHVEASQSFFVGGTRSATYTQSNSNDRTEDRSLYRSGIYANGSYSLGCVALDRSINSEYEATDTASASVGSYTLSQTEFNNGAVSETENGLGVYGNGSYSFGTYARDWDSRTTYSSDAAAAGPNGAGQSVDRWAHQFTHAVGSMHALLETYESHVTVVYSQETYPWSSSSNETGTKDLGGPVELPDANGQGIKTAQAPAMPASQNVQSGGIANAEVRLEAMEGAGASVSGSTAGNTGKKGLIAPRLLQPEAAKLDTTDALRDVYEAGGVVNGNGRLHSASAGETNEKSGNVWLWTEASNVADVLGMVRRGMDVSAFAAGAPQMSGPGASNPKVVGLNQLEADGSWKSNAGNQLANIGTADEGAPEFFAIGGAEPANVAAGGFCGTEMGKGVTDKAGDGPVFDDLVLRRNRDDQTTVYDLIDQAIKDDNPRNYELQLLSASSTTEGDDGKSIVVGDPTLLDSAIGLGLRVHAANALAAGMTLVEGAKGASVNDPSKQQSDREKASKWYWNLKEIIGIAENSPGPLKTNDPTIREIQRTQLNKSDLPMLRQALEVAEKVLRRVEQGKSLESSLQEVLSTLKPVDSGPYPNFFGSISAGNRMESERDRYAKIARANEQANEIQRREINQGVGYGRLASNNRIFTELFINPPVRTAQFGHDMIMGWNPDNPLLNPYVRGFVQREMSLGAATGGIMVDGAATLPTLQLGAQGGRALLKGMYGTIGRGAATETVVGSVAPGAAKPVHIDIWGEGRYPGAVNLNRTPVTSTTGAPGRPIPNLTQYQGGRLPYANKSVDIVTLENAPIRPDTITEIARVIKPGGEVRLVGPKDVVEGLHKKIADTTGGKMYQTTIKNKEGIDMLYTNIVVPAR